MSVRRSKLDIMLSVLSTVKEGVDKPTRIMYATNVSWNSLQEVLSGLVRQELLREIEVPRNKRSRRRYEVTEKGVNVLAYFEGASEILDIEKVVI
jgi:predicted transcriptional regulator